jgi:hypothetical protein
MEISRRSFLIASAGLTPAPMPLIASPPGRSLQAALTAEQVIDRIKANVGMAWRTETVDKIIAGEATTPVKGIATTMMATLEVAERAAAAGKNFLITHEPTVTKRSSCAATTW